MNEGYALHARIFTRKAFADAAAGEALLDGLTRAGLKIARFDSVEPLRQVYAPHRAADAAGLLARDFTLLLRGAKPGWSAYIGWLPERTRPWLWTIDFAEPWTRGAALERLLAVATAACVASDAVFAAAGLSEDWRTRHDIPNRFGNVQRKGANMEPGEGLPGISWYTFFGTALVDQFGRDALLRLPGTALCSDDAHGIALLAYPQPGSENAAWRRDREPALSGQLGAEYFFDPAEPDAPRTPIAGVTDARTLTG